MKLSYIIKLFSKYKRYILVTTLLTIIVSQIFTSFQKPEYKSVTSWMLEEMELSASSSFDKSSSNSRLPQSINMAKYSQNSTMMEAEILRSEPVTKKIYKNCDLPYSYNKFRRNFTVIGDFSPVMDIRIYSNSVDEINKILNVTKIISLESLKVPAEEFHKKNIDTLETLASALKTEFIESQVNLKDTEAKYNTINPMKSAIIYQQNLKKYERLINKTEENLKAVEASYKNKISQLKVGSLQEAIDRSTLASNFNVVETKQELDNERIKHIRNKATYTDEHKEVIEGNDRITLLEKRLHEYYSDVLKRNISKKEMLRLVPFTPLQSQMTMQLINYSLEIKSLKEELKVYKEIYKDENSKLYSAAEQKHILTSLNATAKINMLKLNLILNLITSELINMGLSKNNYLIFELKEPFIKKIAPNYFANALYATGFGLLICFYMIIILEKLNTKINDEDYIKDLNLNIVSTLKNTKDLLYTHHIDKDNIEEYLSIKLHFNELHNNNKLKVFTVLPTTQDNSNSILLTNIAYSIAKSGSKTLLIDLDLEKPQIDKLFQITNKSNNITSFLEEETTDANNIILNSEDSSYLDIIIAKNTNKITREILLNSKKLQNLIKLFKERYEYIFINISNYKNLSCRRLAEDSILLIKINKTAKQELKNIVKHSRLFNIPLSSCIVDISEETK